MRVLMVVDHRRAAWVILQRWVYTQLAVGQPRKEDQQACDMSLQMMVHDTTEQLGQ